MIMIMTANNDKFNQEALVSLYEMWGRRTPSYEKHYEIEVIKPLADFGKGTNEASEAKAKILGAGYEALILAYFIGLYSGKKVPLDQYADIKDLGQPIQYWGNLDSKKGRRAYPKLRDYIFISLIARTPEIDWIAVDMGKWTINETVALLMSTMEEYINYGLSVIAEKLKYDEGYFYSKNAFLDMFKELTTSKTTLKDMDFSDIPEAL